jgi:hypothetical protein
MRGYIYGCNYKIRKKDDGRWIFQSKMRKKDVVSLFCGELI